MFKIGDLVRVHDWYKFSKITGFRGIVKSMPTDDVPFYGVLIPECVIDGNDYSQHVWLFDSTEIVKI